MRTRQQIFLRLSRFVLISAMLTHAVSLVVAQDLPGPTAAAEAFDNAAGKLTDHQYELVYKLKSGESLNYEVVHEALVKTTVQGETQDSQSRSVSGKTWKITEVDASGNSVVTNTIDYINMWSKTGDQPAAKFDSRKAGAPPAEYVRVAEMINIPLAEITIAPTGRIVDRKDHVPQHDIGIGGITVPLPEEAVKIGAEWSTPGVVQVRDSEGVRRAIKTRQLYRLTKVETGIATIELRTEVLTPVQDPRITAQLVQKQANGEIKFDIDAGVIRSRTLQWQENVVSFNGPESHMDYNARLTETLKSARVARK